MGRAIVRNPQVFLMDEPLSNLDAKLRVQTRTQIASLQRRLGVTTVYVTHDQVEAMTMGDRVAVLKDGVLQQVGTARELYDRPANAFVAGFIGSPAMNLLPARVVDAGALLGGLALPLSAAARQQATGEVLVGARPEALLVAAQPTGLELDVDVVEEIGADAYLYGRPRHDGAPLRTDDRSAPLVVRVPGRDVPRAGQTLYLDIDPHQVHVFDPASGLRLG